MKTYFNAINLILLLFFSFSTIATSINIDGLGVLDNLSDANNKSSSYNSKIDGTKVVDNKAKNEVVHTKNSVKRVWDEDGIINVVAEIVDAEQEVNIFVYNMLGKKISKIYQGLPGNKNSEGYFVFTSKASLNLPKNIYILVIQGTTYKVANKFIIAK